MENKANEQVKRKGNLINTVPNPKKKEQIDGTKPIPKGKQLLTEKEGGELWNRLWRLEEYFLQLH